MKADVRKYFFVVWHLGCSVVQAKQDEARAQQVRQDPRLDQVGAELERVCPMLVFQGWELVYSYFFGVWHLGCTYILDPHWVTTAVYRIINNPKIVHDKGVLNLKDLQGILKKRKPKDISYPKAKLPFIINIMKKFELCYSLPEDKVLVPDLLPVSEPPFDFDEERALRFHITYEFLPRTVMARLIVKLHTYIKDGLQWRTGVILESNQALAVIRVDYEDRLLQVLVNGPLKRDFFVVIREALREINQGFSKNRIQEKIACNCPVCLTSDRPHFHAYETLLRFLANGHRESPCDESVAMVSITQLLGDVLGTKEGELESIVKLLIEMKEERDTPKSLVEKVANYSGISGVTLMELIKFIN